MYGLESLAWLPDDRIVYPAVTGDYRNLWITDVAGLNPTQLTFTPNDKSEVSATRDGRYVLYQSQGRIWRVNADGGDAQLTNGALDVHPTASADGHWVIYASFLGWSPAIGSRPSCLEGAEFEGGKPVQLSNEPLSYPSVSPDGKWIVCSYYPDGEPRYSRREMAVLSSEGGPIHVLYDLADIDGELLWAADGQGVNSAARLGAQLTSGDRPRRDPPACS